MSKVFIESHRSVPAAIGVLSPAIAGVVAGVVLLLLGPNRSVMLALALIASATVGFAQLTIP